MGMTMFLFCLFSYFLKMAKKCFYGQKSLELIYQRYHNKMISGKKHSLCSDPCFQHFSILQKLVRPKGYQKLEIFRRTLADDPHLFDPFRKSNFYFIPSLVWDDWELLLSQQQNASENCVFFLHNPLMMLEYTSSYRSILWLREYPNRPAARVSWLAIWKRFI